MGKKFSGVSQTMSRFRGWIQAGATLLTNLHLPNFLKGGLYQALLGKQQLRAFGLYWNLIFFNFAIEEKDLYETLL